MKRYVVVAVVVLVVLALAAPVQADGVSRARMDIQNTALFGAVCDGEALNYVGTLKFRGGDKYDIAFFAPPVTGDPDPDFFTKWVRFDGWWEIYPHRTLDRTFGFGDPPDCPNREDLIRREADGGWGHFTKNKFVGYGPGGFWTGKFVPGPFIPPAGELNFRFVGPFWLFGELEDD